MSRRWAEEKMITRATGAVAVFSASFALLSLFDLFAESLNDGLSESPAPIALALIDALSPISWLIVILPVFIAVLYWRLRPDQKGLSSTIWHGLIMAGAYLAISVGIATSNQFIYLDGQREVTVTRIIGNGFLCALVGAGFVSAFRTQSRAQQAGGGNE